MHRRRRPTKTRDQKNTYPGTPLARANREASGGITLTVRPPELRTTRLTRGLTQKALAEAADISKSYITEMEAGRRGKGTALVVAQRIAAALDVPIGDLFEDPS